MQTEALFTTKSGLVFPSLSRGQTQEIRQALDKLLGGSVTHITEASSYSLAMVIRYALGLSADMGKVCALAGNNLSGAVTLATTRHLHNSGSEISLWLINDGSELSQNITQELGILHAMGVSYQTISSRAVTAELTAFEQKVADSHNVICGMFDANGQTVADSAIINCLNELRTPVHCIDAPGGVDPDSGKPGDTPLFASSTLSLGTVYRGLHAGETYVGRHYLCDISISRELYGGFGIDAASLFSEQPVIQIFPKLPEGAEKD